MKKEIENLYFEILIPNISKHSVWCQIFNSREIKTLFPEPKDTFLENEKGILFWKEYFFYSIEAEYTVLSYKEDSNFLIDILAPGCSSSLLLTLEENTDGILFRLDHRSFIGKKMKNNYRSFSMRWKKLFKALNKKNRS